MSSKCRENPASGPFSRLGWMGRYRAIALALVLGLLAAATLSACGEEEKAELLPGTTAREINANLGLVEDLVASGDCVGAENAAAAVSGQVEELTGVDQKLKETLSQGATRLEEVIGECDEAAEEDEETTSSEEEERDLQELEKEERDEEKAQEKAEKEAEKEQKKEEKPEKETPEKEVPEKEEPEVPPTEPTEPPSGGVSPSTEAGGAE